jgi:hypothetical protein
MDFQSLDPDLFLSRAHARERATCSVVDMTR